MVRVMVVFGTVPVVMFRVMIRVMPVVRVVRVAYGRVRMHVLRRRISCHGVMAWPAWVVRVFRRESFHHDRGDGVLQADGVERVATGAFLAGVAMWLTIPYRLHSAHER